MALLRFKRLALALALGIIAGCPDPTPGGGDDAVVDVATDADGSQADGDGDATVDVPADVEPTAPPDLLLTVNELPTHLNGTMPLPGGNPYNVWVNRENFTLDLLSKAPAEIDWSTLSLICTADLAFADGAVVSGGDNLADRVAIHPLPGNFARRIHFISDIGVAERQQVQCQASVSNSLGSASSQVGFVVATLEPQYDPFIAPDVWLVTLNRDIFDTTFSDDGDGTYSVTSTHVPAGNGVLDFDEAFFGMGFFSATNASARAIVKQRLLDRIRSEAYRIFRTTADGQPTPEGVPLALYFEGDKGAPDPANWSETGDFSMIALGGDGKPADQNSGIVGRADIDWNNQGVENNTVYDRGVYPTGVARQVMGQVLGVLAIADFLPDEGGTPIGDHPDDDELLAPGFNPATISGDKRHRYDLIAFGIDMVGLAIASTLCHEIGHSLGLVPPGPPPVGLFAGMPDLMFIDNYIDGAHIDTAGLNVMQTGAVTNYVEAISQVPEFNALNMAYLRRRLVVTVN